MARDRSTSPNSAASGLSNNSSNGAAYCWAMRSRSVVIAGLSAGTACRGSGNSSRSRPSDNQDIAVRRAGARATLSACSSIKATSRSRSEPSAGGVGDGGIRLLNAAASRSFPLGKWRYRVALATLAVRVTASTVTALGPPARSSVAAASSKRARERAGRGSVLPSPIVTHLPVWKRDHWSTYKTIGLKSRTPPKEEPLIVDISVQPDQRTYQVSIGDSPGARAWTLAVACMGVALVVASMTALNTALGDLAVATSAT